MRCWADTPETKTRTTKARLNIFRENIVFLAADRKVGRRGYFSAPSHCSVGFLEFVTQRKQDIPSRILGCGGRNGSEVCQRNVVVWEAVLHVVEGIKDIRP